MSEESDGVAAVLRSSGVDCPGPDVPRLRVVEANEIPRIQLPGEGRQDSQFAADLAALLRDGSDMFTRDGEVVRVDNAMKSLVPVSARAFKTAVEQFVTTYTIRRHSQGTFELNATMSLETAATVLESSQFKEGLHQVERIHDQRLPALRKDGSLFRLEPGLDVEAKAYTLPSSLDYRLDMPLSEARMLWREVHREFPFSDWSEGGWRTGRSRSFAVHTLAALSQFAWCLVSPESRRLNFIYHSNSERSGKSLLAEIALVLTYGLVATSSWKKDEEKMAGMLDVIVRNRAAYAFLDNLKGRVASEELEGFMTGSARKVRLFHTQIERVFPNRTSCFITGNNLVWSSDIEGRVVVCDLHLEEADPQSRVIEVVRTQESFREPGLRADLLGAIWAMVREWSSAGRPSGTRSRAGFQEWCRVLGGIVEHANFGNPLEPRPEDFSGGDTDFADMQSLVERLAMGVDTVAEYRFADVVQAALATNSFERLMEGKQRRDEQDQEIFILDPKPRSTFSDIIGPKFGGRAFLLEDGRKVRWGMRGKNRSRRYQVMVIARAQGA